MINYIFLLFQVAIFCACLTMKSIANASNLPAENSNSWNEIVQYHRDGGDFFTWVDTSTTTDLWDGIPAGLQVTTSWSTKLSDDGQYIIDTHRMVTEKGHLISIGGGITYWDSKTQQPIGTYSGHDMGNLFYGTASNFTFGKQSFTWNYEETINGKKAVYVIEIERVDENTRKSDVHRADGTGSPWKTTRKRAK